MEKKFRFAMLCLAALGLCACGGESSSVAASSTAPSEDSSVETSSVDDSVSVSSSSSELEAASSVEIPDGYIGIYLHTNFGETDLVYDIIVIEKNTKTSKPSFPDRDGYEASGWYTEATCENAFNFNKVISENVDLYPKWLQQFTFEAEYTDLDGKQGFGYSGGSGGIQMIGKDTYGAGASNGYYVSYLYYKGAYLEWDITADVASTDNIVSFSLSAEFYDYSFDDTTLSITVNDVELEDFNTINLTGAYDVSTSNLRPFTTHVISSSVSLNQGENVVKLTINNSNGHGGTLYSEAPIVDCLYVSSDTSTLTWDPITDNITQWEELH